MNDGQAGMGVRFAMTRGPFQMYGASPWYAEIGIGTPPQPIKFALDSGTNIVWATSTLCGPDGCKHYGGLQFDYAASTSFRFVDRTQKKYSFGPWGDMYVETGSDALCMPNGSAFRIAFYLSSFYNGSQFESIDWDGGIGIPSGSAYVQPGNSFIVEQLMNSGAISPGLPYVSFGWDHATKTGDCIMGGYDEDAFDADSGIFVPWSIYDKFPGVGYIWTTPMQSYAVGDRVLARASALDPYWFALDSGSSQFKGDEDLMKKTLELVSPNADGPSVVITLGEPGKDAVGTLTITPQMYNAVIEAGPKQGEIIPQFQPLELPGLALVGSILMEWCYTVFIYTVVKGPSGYTLAPCGMCISNKRGGPHVVSKTGGEQWTGGPQPLAGTAPATTTPYETSSVRPGRLTIPPAQD